MNTFKEEKSESKGYFQAFRESGEKVWKYKTLWWWGALAALSASYFSLAPNKEQPEGGREMTWREFQGEVQRNWNWLLENFSLVWKIFLAVFFVSLFFWLISLLAKGGLTRFLALKKEKKNWRQNASEVWREGKKSFLPLFKLEAGFLLALLSFLVLAGSCSLGLLLWAFFVSNNFFKVVLGIAFFLSVLFSLLSLFFFLFAKSIADFLVVVLEKKPLAAFWEGGMIVKRKFKEFAKLLGMLFLGAWLASWALEMTGFLVEAFFSGIKLVFGLPFLLENNLDQKFFLYHSNPFLLSLLALLFNGIFTVFKIDYQLWWLEKNQIIQPLKKEKAKQAIAAPENVLPAEELETTPLV